MFQKLSFFFSLSLWLSFLKIFFTTRSPFLCPFFFFVCIFPHFRSFSHLQFFFFLLAFFVAFFFLLFFFKPKPQLTLLKSFFGFRSDLCATFLRHFKLLIFEQSLASWKRSICEKLSDPSRDARITSLLRKNFRALIE